VAGGTVWCKKVKGYVHKALQETKCADRNERASIHTLSFVETVTSSTKCHLQRAGTVEWSKFKIIRSTRSFLSVCKNWRTEDRKFKFGQEMLLCIINWQYWFRSKDQRSSSRGHGKIGHHIKWLITQESRASKVQSRYIARAYMYNPICSFINAKLGKLYSFLRATTLSVVTRKYTQSDVTVSGFQRMNVILKLQGCRAGADHPSNPSPDRVDTGIKEPHHGVKGPWKGATGSKRLYFVGGKEGPY